MKIVSAFIHFAPAMAPDVTGYNLYFSPEGSAVDYDSTKVELGLPAIDEDNRMSVDLREFMGGVLEGKYNIGITAEDDAGNESDMSVGLVEIDFTAPDPPGPLSFTYE